MNTYTITVDWHGKRTCQDIRINGSLLESIVATLADVSRQGYPDEIVIRKATPQQGKRVLPLPSPSPCNLYVFNVTGDILNVHKERDSAEQTAPA